MKFLSRLLAGFSHCRTDSLPKRQPSRLEPLPPEVILCITDVLEKPDIVCLSLCSHYLLELIGKPCLPPGDNSLNAAIVTRIAADLPSMFCCRICAKLHRTALVLHPLQTMDRYNKCPDIGIMHEKHKVAPFWIFFGWFNYSFRQCHLLAVMKNHYYSQPEGLTVDQLAYTSVRQWPLDLEVTMLLSVEGQVCSLDGGHSALILQTQNWFLFHERFDPDRVGERLRGASICYHKDAGYSSMDGYTQSAIQGQAFDRTKNHKFELLNCPTCGIEYQYNLRNCGEDGKAIIITKWMDLGSGTTLNDPKWKRLTSFSVESSECFGTETSPGKTLQLFYHASRAQGRESDPTDRNQSYLVGQQYRQRMYLDSGFVYTSVWPC